MLKSKYLKRILTMIIIINIFFSNFVQIGNFLLQGTFSHANDGEILTTINQELVTYRKIENKALVQVKLQNISEFTGYDKLKINKTTLEIEAPKINGLLPEQVGVKANLLDLSKNNTSEDDGIVEENINQNTVTLGESLNDEGGQNQEEEAYIEREEWFYNEETGKILIEFSPEKEITKTTMDEFIISYVYEGEAYSNIQLNQEIINNAVSKIKMEVAGINQTVSRRNEMNFTLGEEFGYLVTASIKSVEIPKGYMYANYNLAEPIYETEFIENSRINISFANFVDKIEYKDLGSTLVDENTEEYGLKLKYKTLKITKEKFDKFLGPTGYIKIYNQNGEQIGTINQATQMEDKYLVFDYENAEENISIETSKPVREGILEIQNIKAIQADLPVAKETIKSFKTLKVDKQIKSIGVEKDIQAINTLLDTKTNSTIEMDETSLSTIIKNESIQIKILLNNTTPMSDLYVNPVFELEFPEEVASLDINSINGLFDNQLEITNSNLTKVNNKYVLKIATIGTQTRFDMGSITEGMNIVISTNIELATDTPTSQSQLVLKYTNENVNAYESEIIEGEDRKGTTNKIIDFVAPQGIVNINSIENYDGEGTVLQSVSSESKSAEIQMNKGEVIATVHGKVLNNYNYACSEISILGRVPSKGGVLENNGKNYESDMSLVMIGAIQTEQLEDYRIYYSENGFATKDLTILENGWIETPQDYTKIKSYMIVANDGIQFAAKRTIDFEYQIKIPANVAYNREAYQMFTTYYKNLGLASVNEEVNSDVLGLKTPVGPEIAVEYTSSVPNGENVYENQIITYECKVKNIGGMEVDNININAAIPNDCVYRSLNEKYEYVENDEIGNLEATIELLKVGEEKSFIYEVRVKELGTETSRTITSKVTGSSIQIQNWESESLTYTVSKAKLKIDYSTGVLMEVYNNDEISNTLKIENASNEKLENVLVEIKLPKYYEYQSGEKFKKNKEEYSDIPTYDEETRKVCWIITSLDVGESASTFINLKIDDFDGKDAKARSQAIVQLPDNSIMYSNYVVHDIWAFQYELSLTSNLEEGYVQEEDTIDYTIRVRNIGNHPINTLKISNKLPKGLIPENYTCIIDGEETEITIGEEQTYEMNKLLGVNEEYEIKLKAYFSILDENVTSLQVVNEVKCLAPNEEQEKTASLVHVVVAKEEEEIPVEAEPVIPPAIEDDVTVPDEPETPTEPENPEEPENPTNPDEPSDPEEPTEPENPELPDDPSEPENPQEEQKEKYRISGIVWIDKNKNGVKDGEDILKEGITVSLFNKETNDYVIENEKIKSTVTGECGGYLFENVENGEYLIIFEYDNKNYTVTEYQKIGVNENSNSDAIEKSIQDGIEEKTVGITDIIKIENASISNIDVGLKEKEKFDLKLDKYISKVTISNKNGTEIKEYENKQNVKVEIPSRLINGTTIAIEYKMVITNEGEVPGFVNQITDYTGEGLKFNSELNTNWYEGQGGSLINTELLKQIINPGETKEVKVILTRTLISGEATWIYNTAEIAETYNEKLIEDYDSVPNNRNMDEDDISKAEVLVTIKTGEIILYISLIIMAGSIIIGGILYIRKKLF